MNRSIRRPTKRSSKSHSAKPSSRRISTKSTPTRAKIPPPCATPQRSQSTFDLAPDPHHLATQGPEGGAVRSVMRSLLRNTNPRVQGMKPRRLMRKSNAYKAIVNEYRVHQFSSFIDAWKFHSTASEVVISLKAITNNANTLYQSGWKPARPQKQQIEAVSRQIGLGYELDSELEPDRVNLQDMLLFSNNQIRVDPLTDKQQILGDDSKFMDIFGSIDDTASNVPNLQSTFGGGNKNLKKQGIDDHLQQKLFEDFGFDLGSTLDNRVHLVEKLDVQGFPVKYNPDIHRRNGQNGWEVSQMTGVFIDPKSPSLIDQNTNSTWDAAFSHANGALSFSRHLTVRILNSIQHNEDVGRFGILGNLLNGTENISMPETHIAAYLGLKPSLMGRTVM